MLIDELVPGRDSYVRSDFMPPPRGGHRFLRWWTLHGKLRSAEWREKGVVKLRDGFTAHPERESLSVLLDECQSRGVKRPASYAGIWWDDPARPKMPHLRRWHRRWGLWQVRGAWQAILLPRGVHRGSWDHYDIRSAYLGAIAEGLPDPSTYRWASVYKGSRVPGVYLLEIPASFGAPFPYHKGGTVLATDEEIEEYGLQPTEVYCGVTFDDFHSYNTRPVIDSVQQWSCSKEIARSLWGYWATTHPAICHYDSGKNVQLPSRHANPIWAHLVLGRVRRRLWDIVRDNPGKVARVYVDSVVVRSDVAVAVGEGVGDWRHEIRHTHGIDVINAVRYTPISLAS